MKLSGWPSLWKACNDSIRYVSAMSFTVEYPCAGEVVVDMERLWTITAAQNECMRTTLVILSNSCPLVLLFA
jgi:hypothetical protein